MFVGDSLNRNQWESMVCLLQSPGKKSHKNSGSLVIFTIEVHFISSLKLLSVQFKIAGSSDLYKSFLVWLFVQESLKKVLFCRQTPPLLPC